MNVFDITSIFRLLSTEAPQEKRTNSSVKFLGRHKPGSKADG